MAICQIMIKDFLFGYGGLGNGYDAYDLGVGKAYAHACLEDGYTFEPFWYYNLREFIAWCRIQERRLNQCKHTV